MKRKSFLAVLVFVLYASSISAQTRYSDRCEVVVAEIAGRHVENLESLSPVRLATFDTVIGEEELTTRAFRLPNTRLFIVASVWYTDESMAGENSQDSVCLELAISRTARRDILSSLQFAEAEVLSLNFDVARVTTIFRTQRRSFYVAMECRKHNRP